MTPAVNSHFFTHARDPNFLGGKIRFQEARTYFRQSATAFRVRTLCIILIFRPFQQVPRAPFTHPVFWAKSSLY